LLKPLVPVPPFQYRSFLQAEQNTFLPFTRGENWCITVQTQEVLVFLPPERATKVTSTGVPLDESNVLELGSVPSCTRAAAEPAGVATGRPSGPAGPTPTDSWPAAGAAASLAAGAATSPATQPR
ncbi:unnamed protein product, partial [Laminaria digitata]